jgi:hypothetical protein
MNFLDVSSAAAVGNIADFPVTILTSMTAFHRPQPLGTSLTPPLKASGSIERFDLIPQLTTFWLVPVRKQELKARR